MLRYNLNDNKFIEIDPNTVTDNLKEECGFCGSSECYFNCDYSVAEWEDGEDGANLSETEEEVIARAKFNGAIDGLKSLLFAFYSADQDMPTDVVMQNAVNAIIANK